MYSSKTNGLEWGAEYPGLYSINYLPLRDNTNYIYGLSEYCKFDAHYSCTVWSANITDGTFSVLGWNFGNQ